MSQMGPKTAVISAPALGPLHLSQPTLPVCIGASRSCQSGSDAYLQMFAAPPNDDCATTTIVRR